MPVSSISTRPAPAWAPVIRSATIPLVLGRGSDCEIRINDHSVSRKHARIQPGIDGYYAVDLQSTNGTFVNDVPASMYKLKDGDYLRVGNCIYRFLMGGNVETEYHEEIYRLTIIDALTDIHNKRYLLEFLDRELARSSRYNRPLSLIMIDIDRFKNDQRRARPSGRRFHAARTRGPHQGNDSQRRAVRPLRRRGVRRRAAGNANGRGPDRCRPHSEGNQSNAVPVRGQIVHGNDQRGVVYTQGEAGITTSELLRRADEKLYQAKELGRNRVCR